MFKKYDRGASKHVYDILKGEEPWIYAYESKQHFKGEMLPKILPNYRYFYYNALFGVVYGMVESLLVFL